MAESESNKLSKEDINIITKSITDSMRSERESSSLRAQNQMVRESLRQQGEKSAEAAQNAELTNSINSLTSIISKQNSEQERQRIDMNTVFGSFFNNYTENNGKSDQSIAREVESLVNKQFSALNNKSSTATAVAAATLPAARPTSSDTFISRAFNKLNEGIRGNSDAANEEKTLKAKENIKETWETAEYKPMVKKANKFFDAWERGDIKFDGDGGNGGDGGFNLGSLAPFLLTIGAALLDTLYKRATGEAESMLDKVNHTLRPLAQAGKSLANFAKNPKSFLKQVLGVDRIKGPDPSKAAKAADATADATKGAKAVKGADAAAKGAKGADAASKGAKAADAAADAAKAADAASKASKAADAASDAAKAADTVADGVNAASKGAKVLSTAMKPVAAVLNGVGKMGKVATFIEPAMEGTQAALKLMEGDTHGATKDLVHAGVSVAMNSTVPGRIIDASTAGMGWLGRGLHNLTGNALGVDMSRISYSAGDLVENVWDLGDEFANDGGFKKEDAQIQNDEKVQAAMDSFRKTYGDDVVDYVLKHKPELAKKWSEAKTASEENRSTAWGKFKLGLGVTGHDDAEGEAQAALIKEIQAASQLKKEGKLNDDKVESDIAQLFGEASTSEAVANLLTGAEVDVDKANKSEYELQQMSNAFALGLEMYFSSQAALQRTLASNHDMAKNFSDVMVGRT